MKKGIIFILVVSSLIVSGQGYQDFDSNKVPKTILTKFYSLYPKASSVTWYQPNEDISYETTFLCNCKEDYSSATFDKNGTVINKDRIVNIGEAPENILKYLQKHYSKYLLPFSIDENIDRNGIIKFNARVDILSRLCSDCEFYWVVFDKEGEFISERHVPGGI